MLLATFTAAVMASLSTLHFYWALGGQWGIRSAVPQLLERPEFRPSALLTSLVGCVLMGLALLALLLNSPEGIRWIRYPGYLVSAGMLLRAIGDFRYVGFFKKVYNSPFALRDTRYFSPLILILSCCFFILSGRVA